MCVLYTGIQDELRVNSNYDVTAEIGKEEDYIVQSYDISADVDGSDHDSW